ncbi:ribbon-helix-helix domain-containing protein [Methylocystis rosea]|uniref:Type II toxin-antitoxin system ParD family antitoxin n=1 Tax=Methylocystis rosea TaxID=173366 RepID=A0A3G8M3A5_9HYPH|nr:type II toxin-antitoxin system ParD family antitoxin [Methylocystis rosea]AZG76459.1 type II toxin-antitoxin system ParD family antitoxin [Methylocystis rosea]
MRTLHISLPEELESELAAAVDSGEFESENDAIRAAVAQWRAERLVERMSVDELRRLWREGVESGSGRFGEIDEIKAEARRRHSQS